MFTFRSFVMRGGRSAEARRVGSKKRRSQRRRGGNRLRIERLEDRSLMAGTVHFTIDPQADVKPISRYIYGANQLLDGAYATGTGVIASISRFSRRNRCGRLMNGWDLPYGVWYRS